MSGCRLFYPVSIQTASDPVWAGGLHAPRQGPPVCRARPAGDGGPGPACSGLGGSGPPPRPLNPTGNLVFSAAKRRVLQNIGEETLLSVAHMQPRDLQARADG